MPLHPEFTATFHGAILAPAGAAMPGLANADEAARRFAVYRNNVAHSLGEAFGARFPAVRRLVGDAFFGAMAQVYLREEPPRSPVLMTWGQGFAAFLERFPPAARLPYLPDVARIDHAVGSAYHAADVPPLAPDALTRAAANADTARLGLHPSVHVLHSAHAAATIWLANQPDTTPQPIDAGQAEIALVLRNKAFDIEVEAISAADAAFVETLAHDTLFAAARAGARAIPGHDPGPILVRLARAGVLTEPNRRPR